jgi:hypothetical protein
MMLDFYNFILTFKLMLESKIKNNNFYLKNFKDNFEEKYHLDDRFRFVYF